MHISWPTAIEICIRMISLNKNFMHRSSSLKNQLFFFFQNQRFYIVTNGIDGIDQCWLWCFTRSFQRAICNLGHCYFQSSAFKFSKETRSQVAVLISSNFAEDSSFLSSQPKTDFVWNVFLCQESKYLFFTAWTADERSSLFSPHKRWIFWW